jgi:hypothetical protein
MLMLVTYLQLMEMVRHFNGNHLLLTVVTVQTPAVLTTTGAVPSVNQQLVDNYSC